MSKVNSGLVQVGLVGCGAVSQLYYVPALKELVRHNLVQVKALFDPAPENVAQVNRSFPAAVQVKDLAELPKLGIDLAIIASPPRYHAEQTIQLLKAGLSVLCEKPMAVTAAEGEAMVEAAAAAPGILAIGLFRRFLPATQAIRDLLALNLLGDIKTFYAYEGGNFSWPVQSAGFFHKATPQGRGGVLLDIGVHLLDLLIWWWGKPVEVHYEDDAMGGIEANCRLQLKFAPGFTGEVRLSRDWSLPNRYVIQGSQGWLSWNVHEAGGIEMGFYQSGFALKGNLHRQDCEHGLPALGPPGFTFEQSFIRQLCNVVAAIGGTEPLVVSGAQGLESLKLIETCYQHRTLMAMPWLSEAETVSAQRLSRLLS